MGGQFKLSASAAASVASATPFLLYINDFHDVIGNNAVYADNTTIYSNCYQASDLWQRLKLASEFGSDI